MKCSRVGFTSGCFDLLHYGHVEYLRRCSRLCDLLIVGVDSDVLVSETKGPQRPIIPEQERLQMVWNLHCVGHAFILHDPKDLVQLVPHLRIRQIYKHQGFTVPAQVYGVGPGLAELVIVPDIPGLVSTTEIIERILARYMEAL